MKKIFLLLSLSLGLINFSFAGEAASTKYTFADIATGQKILTADDNYMNRMGTAEIAIRTGSTTADKTVEDLKALYKANVLEWTEDEKMQITKLVKDNAERLARIQHLLPSEVTFIKVNDKVEGGLPHTRANAIVLPVAGGPLDEVLFYHELFHVLSRTQASRHNSLYALIGFKPCEYAGNEQVNAISLTNPDVPAEGYYLPVTVEGKATAIMTFLHAAHPAFDPTIERGFGGHFGFGLLKVSVENGTCSVDTNAEGKAQILNPGAVEDFFKAIGTNTQYIIHPEEVLADNFVFAMTDKKDLPNPEVPNKLNEWMAKK